MSFEKTGVLDGKEESDKVYKKVIIGAQIAILIAVPLYGWYVDKADSRVLTPMTFFLRSVLAFSFGFV